MNDQPINQRPDAVTSIRDAIRALPLQSLPDGVKTEVLNIPINSGTKIKGRKAPSTNKVIEDATSRHASEPNEHHDSLLSSRANSKNRKPSPAKKAIDDTPYRPAPGSLADGSRIINVKTANEWLDEQRLRPAPRKLFGDFWLEGELCLLFADTNMGKSILAVQIGDSISRRTPIAPFEQDAIAAPVLYIDYELSAKQFQLRYHDAEAAHRFSGWFYRAEYNTQMEVPAKYTSFDDYMRDCLDWAIRNTEPKTLIIDNITCLSEGNHQTATRAIGLMKYLKTLQSKNNLSILVLAHTPKRQSNRPLGRDDMGGSKMLMNFADSAFAIGQSNMPGSLRYLKQVKQRSGGEQYGEDNICLISLMRKNGFLHYQFCGYGNEREHLRTAALPLPQQVAGQVTDLHRQGLSQRKIAARLQIGKGSVSRIVDRLKQTGTDVAVPGVG